MYITNKIRHYQLRNVKNMDITFSQTSRKFNTIFYKGLQPYNMLYFVATNMRDL